MARIRRSHRRGPGSIPGVGTFFLLLFYDDTSDLETRTPIWIEVCTYLHMLVIVCAKHQHCSYNVETYLKHNHTLETYNVNTQN